MHAIVSNMPGFVSVKLFTAEDGEALALASLSRSTLSKLGKSIQNTSWLNKRGREEFFAAYHVQVCSVIREAKFQAQTI